MANFPLKSQYPHIGNIINNDLPKIINDSKKFSAFKKFGGFSDNEARQALKSDSSIPTISIRDYRPNLWGYYAGMGNEVNLSKTIADQYETLLRKWSNSPEFSASAFSSNAKADKTKNAKWLKIISLARLQIEATILHEIVHWGDANALGANGQGNTNRTKDHLAQRKGWADLGHLFVERAYGSQIGFSKFKILGGRYIKQSDVGINNWLGWNQNNVPH